MKKIVLTVLLAIGHVLSVAGTHGQDLGDFTPPANRKAELFSCQNDPALTEGQKEILKNFGVSLTTSSQYQTLAHQALKQKRFDLVEELLDTKTIDINATRSGKFYNPLLHQAIIEYHKTEDSEYLQLIAFLVLKGADLTNTHSVYIDEPTGEVMEYVNAIELAQQLGVNNDIARYLKQ